MNAGKKSQIIEAQPPSEEDHFYLTWGRETLKNNLAFTNEVLRQLVTLNVSLLGGSIAFLDEKLIDPNFKKVVIILFFLSLVVSFIGMMPYQSTVDLRIPAKIKENRAKAFKWKRRCLWIAGGLLGAAFVTALLGLIVH